MKKIFIITALFVGVVIGGAVLVTASANEKTNISNNVLPAFEVNENGQTFGSSMYCTRLEDFPELVKAADKNGVEGYVYFDDLYDYIPSSPEEAEQYMNKIRGLNEKGITSRTIPLYESDGITVIGEYEVSMDLGMFKTASDMKASFIPMENLPKLISE